MADLRSGRPTRRSAATSNDGGPKMTIPLPGVRPLAWTIHEDRSEGTQSPGWWAPAGPECSEAYLRYVAGAEGRGRPPGGMYARPQ